jgi:hypothetical protein
MKRTRYRLLAIALICTASSVGLLWWAPDWIWLALLVGALAFVAEIARHLKDVPRLARKLDDLRDD